MNTQYAEMFDRISARRDRIDEEGDSAYNKVFACIEAALIAANIAEGADDNYKPDGAEVDRLTKLELRRNDG